MCVKGDFTCLPNSKEKKDIQLTQSRVNNEKKIMEKYWNFFPSDEEVFPDLSVFRRHWPLNIIAVSDSYSLNV